MGHFQAATTKVEKIFGTLGKKKGRKIGPDVVRNVCECYTNSLVDV